METGERIFNIILIIIVFVLFGGPILCTLLPDIREQWRKKRTRTAE